MKAMSATVAMLPVSVKSKPLSTLPGSTSHDAEKAFADRSTNQRSKNRIYSQLV